MSVPVPRLLLSVLIAAQLAACSSGAPVAAPTPAAEQLAERADAAVASPVPSVAPPAAAAPSTVPARPMAAGKVAHEMARRAVIPSLMPAPMPRTVPDQPSNERYGAISDNPIHHVAEAPVSTFSVDVDTGSYSNVRRLLNGGALPPSDAVRVEELINYFPYDYALPRDGRPFAVHTALAPAPWNAQRVLLRVAIKGQDVAQQNLPPANLVFLVDVSGSMESADKLPLLRSSLKLLVDQMRPVDRLSLVTYAGSTQVVLPPTSGADKATIKAAIDGLRAGGGTAGASGIELAYRAAQQSFIDGGINRILLATDGDFNVGVSDTEQLKKMVEAQRRTGISLSTLGFGTGNYNEQLMEQIADVGDGAYSYVDNLMEGHKVLVSEMTSTLATIARDVKVQIEFNPALVQEYRQIGYENRQLRREDFHNDQVDAGDIGAGHTVTALYELTLTGARGAIDALRYGTTSSTGAARSGGLAEELAHLRLRYKRPGQSRSELIETPIRREAMRPLDQADADFRFATAVAGFGQVLRGGRHTGGWTVADARVLAAGSLGDDRFGYRGEFLRLAGLAQALAK